MPASDVDEILTLIDPTDKGIAPLEDFTTTWSTGVLRGQQIKATSWYPSGLSHLADSQYGLANALSFENRTAKTANASISCPPAEIPICS
jgi:hypothetical protein